MSPDVGRNDPCPCGSGKKFKKCCLKPTRSKQRGIKAESTAGPRPIISAKMKDLRVVAVGDELHWSPNWRTFPDFLNDYVKRLLGLEWGTRELGKPFEDRHPLIQLYSRKLEVWNNQERGPDGLYRARPSGPMARVSDHRPRPVSTPRSQGTTGPDGCPTQGPFPVPGCPIRVIRRRNLDSRWIRDHSRKRARRNSAPS